MQQEQVLSTSLEAEPRRGQTKNSRGLGGGGRRLQYGTEGATTEATHRGVEPGAVGLPAHRPRCSK